MARLMPAFLRPHIRRTIEYTALITGKMPKKPADMKTYETHATVERQGDVRVVGVPFAPGIEVEVPISPKRAGAVEFAQAWERVSKQLRSVPQAAALTDDDIQREINEYRAGR